MIIETSANQLYTVTETDKLGLEHCWYGYSVKKRAHREGGFVLTASGKRAYEARRPELVRKAAARIVQVAS